MNKILISAPIGGLKQYSINLWFEYIARQKLDFDSYDICICVNGKGYQELANKLGEVEIYYPDRHKKKVNTLILPDSEDLSVIQKITYAREMIRRYAVENNYTHIFFLDTDTIPSNKDAIARLLTWNVPCVSGLYFYKNSKVPVVIDQETNTNITIEKCKDAVMQNKLIPVWGFGFGCLLLERKVFEKLAFDYELFGEERSDDFGYCHALEQAGVTRYLDPYVLCKHFADSEAPKEHNTILPFYIK